MAPCPRVLRAIYRCALRNAAHFDRQPALKVLLSRDPDVTPPADTLAVDAALRGFLGSDGFYVPSLPQPRSATHAVRAAFRAPREADLDQGLQAMRLLQRALNHAAALKLLPARAAAAPSSPAASDAGDDAAPASAAEASQWALLPPPPARGAPAPSPLSPLAAPGVGVLLLSHPRLGDYFHRKVILLCEHDAAGARGLVLNAPTPFRAGLLAAMLNKRLTRDQAWLKAGPGDGQERRAHFFSLKRAEERFRRAFAAAAARAAAESESRGREAPPPSASAIWSEHDDLDDNDNDDFDSYDDSDGELELSDEEGLGEGARGMIIEARGLEGLSDMSDSDSDEDSDDDDETMSDASAVGMALLASEVGPELLKRCWRNDVYNGGPVPGFAVLHSCPDVGGTPVLADGAGDGAGGVYLNGDTKQLASLLADEASRRRSVRLYAGEAAWSGGQLEAELARGEWLLASAAPDWVLGAAAHEPNARSGCMWQRAMRALGGEHAAMAALPRRVGRDDAPAQHPFSVRVHLL